MSFLDNLESNLKSMESREERGDQKSRDAKQRDSERARTQASAVYAEQLRKSPYAAELENNAKVRSVPVDLAGNPEGLAREWLASLPPVPAAVLEEDLE